MQSLYREFDNQSDDAYIKYLSDYIVDGKRTFIGYDTSNKDVGEYRFKITRYNLFWFILECCTHMRCGRMRFEDLDFWNQTVNVNFCKLDANTVFHLFFHLVYTKDFDTFPGAVLLKLFDLHSVKEIDFDDFSAVENIIPVDFLTTIVQPSPQITNIVEFEQCYIKVMKWHGVPSKYLAEITESEPKVDPNVPKTLEWVKRVLIQAQVMVRLALPYDDIVFITNPMASVSRECLEHSILSIDACPRYLVFFNMEAMSVSIYSKDENMFCCYHYKHESPLDQEFHFLRQIYDIPDGQTNFRVCEIKRHEDVPLNKQILLNLILRAVLHGFGSPLIEAEVHNADSKPKDFDHVSRRENVVDVRRYVNMYMKGFIC